MPLDKPRFDSGAAPHVGLQHKQISNAGTARHAQGRQQIDPEPVAVAQEMPARLGVRDRILVWTTPK